MPQQIPPPGNTDERPDKDTKKFSDMTGDRSPGRVLFINLWFFKYGTDDKIHAAAIVLSGLLFLTIVAWIFLGPVDGDWKDTVFSWLSGTFLFVAGIALGKGGGDGNGGSE